METDAPIGSFLHSALEDKYLSESKTKVYSTKLYEDYCEFFRDIQDPMDFDGFGNLFRDLEISIEAVDIGKDDLDNKLDAMAETIERLFDGWEMPNRKNAVLRFKSTETDMNIVGNNIYGAIKLTCTLTYQTETTNEH